MRKFIFKLLVLSIIAFFAYLLVVGFFCVMRKPVGNLYFSLGSKEFTYNRLNEIEQYRDVDVLFCGSSHAFRQIDVRNFEKHGIRCFNLGTATQTPEVTRYLLEKYLDTLSPKVVVYEVFPETLCPDVIEPVCEIVSNTTLDREITELALSKKSLSCFNVLMGSMMYDILKGKENFTAPTSVGTHAYVSGGYVENSTTEIWNDSTQTFKDYTILFSENQKTAFEACLQLFEERGIRYVFVEAPVTKPLYRSYKNHDDFESIIASYGQYINYNTYNIFDDSLFYDSNHLNKNGVQVFNRQLISDLDSLKIYPELL